MLRKLFRIADTNDVQSEISEDDIKSIEEIIQYHFRQKIFLITAFKHRSYLTINKEPANASNERLEFLGDAVLELIVTETLYKTLPDELEGILSKQKAILVSRPVLAEIVEELNLGTFLLVNKGEEKTGGKNRTSNLANLYEAIVGAIYLDGGFIAVQKFVKNTLLTKMNVLVSHQKYVNYKSVLLELIQAQNIGNPEYSVIRETGPDHDKTFTISVQIQSGESAEGNGTSKKIAEQKAAQNLLKKIAPQLLK